MTQRKLSAICCRALAVAKTGLPVFPTIDKRPCWSNEELGVAKGEGGYKIATTNPARIKELFSHPSAKEIGVPMGAMSGLICVDVDSYKDNEKLSLWITENAKYLSDTQLHETRSGGQHYIFQHPGDEYRFPSKLRDGIDLKAGGNGYICWPGTEGYMALNKHKPRPFPLDLLRDAMIARGGSGNITTGSFNEATDEDLIMAIQEATDFYPALRTLSWRLPTRRNDEGRPLDRDTQVEILQSIMHDSVAADGGHSRHDDWLDRYGKIEELVESAIRKQSGSQICDAMLATLQDGDSFMPDISQLASDGELDGKSIERPSNDNVRFYSIDELINRPLPEQLIEGMLPTTGVGIVAGASGEMKSFLALSLGLSIACGTDLDRLTVKPSGVLYLANEGQAGVGQRLAALLKHNEIDAPKNFCIARSTPDLMRSASLELFFEAIDQLNFVPGIIFIDTLSKATTGGDDNSTKDMAQAISTAQALAERFECLVMLIDHVGKDPKKGVRGAYAKHANADMVGMVSKVADTVTLKTTKQKDFEDGSTFSFKVNIVELKCLQTGEMRKVPALSYRPDNAPPPQPEYILVQLTHDGRTERNALAERFMAEYEHKDKKGFNEVVRRLINSGDIEEVDDVLQIKD